jgi:UDP-N-acetyl-2-amino-2-deoxyglucuronate dehydrogenase
MKYALIGCGRIAKSHVQAAIHNSLEIVAICDIEIEKTHELSAMFSELKNVHCFKDYKAMIDNIEIDLIAIATPNNSHAPIAIQCMQKGIHVIIEKPVAITIDDYKTLLKTRNEYNVKVSVCHQNRFNKSIQKVKDAIDQGDLGKINFISAKVFWYRDDNYYNLSSWRGSRSQLDGALLNQSIHNIDLLLWLMDSNVKDVLSFTSNFMHPQIEMEDFGAALIKFVNGSIGLIEATTAAYPSNLEESIYLFAERGTIKVGGQSVNTIDEWKLVGQKNNLSDLKKIYSENPLNIYGNGHLLLYSDMIDSINLNKSPLVSLEEAYKSLELILNIYISSEND